MNVTEILRRHAADVPDAVALIDRHRGRSRSVTYRQLEKSVGRTAALLRKSGLQPGDAVLLLSPMSVELYLALAAILRCGMTAMFLDPSAGRRSIDRCCELLPPQALIASSRAHLLRALSPGLRRIPRMFSIGRRIPRACALEGAANLPYEPAVEPCNEHTPALVSFTSGSTGEPKGAVRTHGFLLAQHRAVEQALALSPGQVELVTLPIFVLANLASRVTSVIADADLRRPGEINAGPMLDQLQRHAADRVVGSPALFERVVTHCEQHNIELPTLQQVFTGGGPVSATLLERLQRIAPAADITAVYGSTEAEPISTLRLVEIGPVDREAMGRGEGLLAGRPVDSLSVRIMEDQWGAPVGPFSNGEFARLCRPPRRAGEIVVSGEHVLPGYLHGEEESETKFRVDGTVWHRTGDAGCFDESERLWLLGRCAARVEDGRGTLYPLGVEQAALREPGIQRAAMTSHRGQRVLAVTLKERGAPPDLTSLLETLSFADVDAIRVLKRIPVDRRHNSKIDYPALQSLLDR
jgi:olefin beta-lactone synthetase